jgi:hypothetical protein
MIEPCIVSALIHRSSIKLGFAKLHVKLTLSHWQQQQQVFSCSHHRYGWLNWNAAADSVATDRKAGREKRSTHTKHASKIQSSLWPEYLMVTVSALFPGVGRTDITMKNLSIFHRFFQKKTLSIVETLGVGRTSCFSSSEATCTSN